jgi:hypothetical protein
MKKIEWNKVTWYSKLIALFLFFIVLLTGIYIGSEFQKFSVTSSDYNNQQVRDFPTLKEKEISRVVYLNGGQLSQYTDEEIGLQFEFNSIPNGYTLEEAEDINTIKTLTLQSSKEYSPINSDGTPAITIEVFNPGPNTTPNDWILNYPHSNYTLESKTENIEIDNKNALSYNWNGLYQGETTTVAHKGWVYSISVMYNEKNSQIYKDYKDLLSSIKILVIN